MVFFFFSFSSVDNGPRVTSIWGDIPVRGLRSIHGFLLDGDPFG